MANSKQFKSVLEAIQMGIWDFEPRKRERENYDATEAMPGSEEKLRVLARRVREGLPLWHDHDRTSYED
ncbi:MAG: hypothetical protein KDA61_14425 [Planctomycetales bacterium]|nr:hypothetical protein [Planctomycetales bacterium]